MGFQNIYELQKLKGAKAKCDYIKAHAGNRFFEMFLYYALNPLLTYNISEQTESKLLDVSLDDTGQKLVFFNDIFTCCEYLSRLRGLDGATIRQVETLLSRCRCEEEKRLYVNLLAKSLRLGITAKTVNKIIPGLIPEWEIQQAYPIDKYPVEVGTEFWLTEKLNGNRATFYNGRLLARSGAEYKGLDHITSKLGWATEAGLVLDGELVLADKQNMSDNEAFRVATGILNSDSMNKIGICFTIFDVIPAKDFDSAAPKVLYESRRLILDDLGACFESCGDAIRVLPVLYHGTDLSKIDDHLEQMVSEDKEGLMLNKNVPYKRTRHKGILKVKRFYTMDLLVIGCEEGTGRLKGTLGALVLRYKDGEVRVGSGFTDEQRKTLWESRESILGSLCEVKYKDISKDKRTGVTSLQFPVFVRIRDDKTEESYG